MKKSKEVQFPRNLRSQIINEAEFYQVENCYKISYLGYVLNMYIISPQTKSSTKKITQNKSINYTTINGGKCISFNNYNKGTIMEDGTINPLII
jgi:hypothetical protein